ncbi:MAG: anhydro-N-acetylmuramic acid kinase [Cyclobacteriaceae bacterium]|nr:anhydro-N-acetylmuramic acid kinase [Cyclobacteriaceae bacterium]MCH8517167.1 anhydro-N-acetylmuramic acid kinase [Cyclobacteriaceae bacterium]
MNQTEVYYTIGLMSGTSMDGLDVAYCRFTKGGNWSYSILEAETIDFPHEIRAIINWLPNLQPTRLLKASEELGDWMGKACAKFIKDKSIDKVEFIASHGHTVFHQPENKLTYQAGCGQALALASGHQVIYDFRKKDILMGGQGAPLVPIGDRLLFGDYDCCINFGGIANCSMERTGNRIAWDICPVNLILNPVAQRLGYEYDDQGHLAKSGKLINELLFELENLSFYKQKPPKSLGREWVEKEITRIESNFETTREIDILSTYTEHIANRIVEDLIKDGQLAQGAKILLSGGGAKNKYLISRLEALAPHYQWEVPEINVLDFKEALIFAFLGVLRIRNENNILSSVTGASSDSCSGIVAQP